MEPSSPTSASTSRTQDTCPSKPVPANTLSNDNSPPGTSSATANATPAQIDTSTSRVKSVTIPRQQNWRKTDKYFSLISTAISGPLKISPWARSPSLEGHANFTRTNTAATKTVEDSVRQRIPSLTTINADKSSFSSAPTPQETVSERADIAIGSSTQGRATRLEPSASLRKPGISIDTELGKIQDTPLAALRQSEVSGSIVQGAAEADAVPGNQDGRKRMSQPATSFLLKRLTENPPPLLPEPPRSKTILSATQPVLSTFFHTINPSSRNSQGENIQRPNQRRRASVPDASHQDIGPSGILLSLNIASSSVQPSIAADGGVSGHRMHSLDSTARHSHNRDSKGNNVSYHEQQNQQSQDISQSASSKISKLQMTRSITRSNSVPPLGNTRDEKDIDIVEFIPSSLERVPNTQMDEEGYDSRIPTNSYSPVVSSSLDGSLPRGREIVSNSMDQSWSQASSPTTSAKRDGNSMTSSQDRKKRSKRKKLRRSSSSGTVAESPEPSSLISSTALFEANMADIERYVDQDLYGYNNLSY